MEPQQTSFAIPQIIKGNEAEYMVEEDDRYQIGVLNMNDKNIVLNLNVNVSAKVYDTSKANNIYSSVNGSCTLSLLFPNTYYVILTAPKNVGGKDDGDDEGGFVEVSFIARVFAYIAVLGLCIIVIFMILRCLGPHHDVDDHNSNNVTMDNNNNAFVASSQDSRNEITEPMMHHHVKINPIRHRTKNNEEEEESEDGSSCSSEELYDEKLCVICYDEQRNCFFVPCGHSATCFDCAKRIVDGESKVCPVCRRLIHKVRRIFIS
ncbi:hypothetical protein PIB30_016283 [Stylosanthes scabra]|uniref:RING-type domain-containing protein n=1 Tax=Stylosanthes scabra TaxID=79078 RepID=A0ABU6Z5V4_9FABA|nr:hypothetical protein [Stylosanthes scabra]